MSAKTESSLKGGNDICGASIPFNNKRFSSNINSILDKVVVAKNIAEDAFNWLAQGGYMGKNIPDEVSQRLPQFGDTTGFDTSVSKGPDTSKEQLGGLSDALGVTKMRNQGGGR